MAKIIEDEEFLYKQLIYDLNKTSKLVELRILQLEKQQEFFNKRLTTKFNNNFIKLFKLVKRR